MLSTGFFFNLGNLPAGATRPAPTPAPAATPPVLALLAGLPSIWPTSATSFSLSSPSRRTASLSRFRFLLLKPCGTAGRSASGRAPVGARMKAACSVARGRSGVRGGCAKLMVRSARKVKSPGAAVARRAGVRVGVEDARCWELLLWSSWSKMVAREG